MTKLFVFYSILKTIQGKYTENNFQTFAYFQFPAYLKF